ncbi:MAG: phosphotriesterase-related protein [Chloroflexi bacterium]|nr:MAG: phosphotriesterase-related protein [Chloroflexota bacterium]
MIQTVCGPIEPDTLGVTLGHEHLLIDLRELWDEPATDERRALAQAPITLQSRATWAQNPYESRDNLLIDDEDAAVEELRAFAQAGGRSLIDMTVDGLDPKPEALRRISQRSGVQILMGTGVYRAFAHPPWVAGMTVDELAARFVGAIQVGINGTDVRAGLLGELGTSSPILPDEVKVLRAAARAHFKTGVSINVHPAIFHREGPRILDVLEAEGVDLRRVALSHMDEQLDHDYHRSLAGRGAWLSFDTLGSEETFGPNAKEPTDDQRVDALLRLLDAGWSGQILLSQDVCTKLQLLRFGGKGYSHVLTAIVPRLRAAGLGQAAISELLVDNPRRFLTGRR